MFNIAELVEQVKLKYPSIYMDLFISGKLNTDNDILLQFELYDLVPRDEILSKLRSGGNKYLIVPSLSNADNLRDKHRLDNEGLLVMHYNEEGSELDVVCTEFIDFNKNVEVFFSKYDFNIYYVTPLNYKILKEGTDCVYRLYDPIVYFKKIVYDALESNCSDIHFSNHMINKLDYDNSNDLASYKYLISFRILNDLIEQTKYNVSGEFMNRIIEEIVDKKTFCPRADLNNSKGVKGSWLNPLGGGECNLRITCSKTNGGFTCVVRITTLGTSSKRINELGFPENTVEFLTRLSNKETGLTIITGPPRSGKNTTMNAIVNEILSKKKLSVIEYSSPIEIIQSFEQLDYFSNRQVLLDYIELAKKQDINIAILNELPTKDVASAVIDLVNSSIGVLTTFHIERIWDLPYKLKDYFGDSYTDLITRINGIANQKMFIKQCPHCRRSSNDFDSLNPQVLELLQKFNMKTFIKSEGCSRCNFTRKSNSVQPYSEFLYFTNDIKSELLHCDKPYQMEEVLRKHVESSKNSLEFELIKAVKLGDLHPNDLITIL